jgi:Fanconi anemia group M protein
MPFHDIFSKKESKKQKNKLKIFIDNREKNSLIPSELVSQNIQIEFKHLPVGDYLVNDVAIERKTLNDLKSSIINKRIFFQLKELKQYPKHLLVIEGFQENNIYEGIIHENALRGFILSTLLENQVPIVFTQNEKDTARYLSVLASKTKKTAPSLRQKIPFTEQEQKQFILEGFPGIGPSTAEKLIQKFKSIKNIINAEETELQEILGKKAESFKKIIS